VIGGALLMATTPLDLQDGVDLLLANPLKELVALVKKVS
jgi:hypothetical protein